MNIALCNEVLHPLPFEQQCRLAAALGYDGLEIAPFTLTEDPSTLDGAAAARFAGIARDHGLAITGLHWLLVAPAGLSIVDESAAVRERTTAFMERLVELCAAMGGRYLVHGSPKQRSVPPGSTPAQAWERARACLARAGARAQACGVTYCVEPLSPRETDLFNTVEDAARLVREVGSPGLKTMVDCSAAGQAEAMPVDQLMARWLPTGLIAHVQVNDPNRRGPGQGGMDFAPILRTLLDQQRQGHYGDWIAVEPFDYVPDGPGCAARSIGYLRGVLQGVRHTMADAPRFRIEALELFERPVHLRLPFRFGVVTLRQAPQAFVRARIALAGGQTAWGAAAELMAPKWFDKNLQLSNEDNFGQLRDVLRMAQGAYLSDTNPATAFGHFARHIDAQLTEGARRGFNPLLASYGPALVDRAVLDALCRAQGLSFYAAMQRNLAGIDASHPQFAGLDVAGLLATLRPADSIEARHTVGLVDAITAADLGERVDDGLPETLEEVIAAYGHRWFKLKVGGDIAADIARLQSIAAVLDRGAAPYFASLDGNEQYESAQAVGNLLAAIQSTPGLARLWSSIAFIEQPITRKLALEADLHGAELGKPVIIDESDGELDSFVRARARGYAGVSSKTCKGVYRSLLNAARCAAWNAEERTTRYFMSAEDLTTQAGLAVQQDLALVNLLGITHVERNGHHYVNGMAALPAGEQQAFLDAHPDLYERSHGAVRLAIRDGRIAIGSLGGVGFASGALPDFDAMQPLGRGAEASS